MKCQQVCNSQRRHIPGSSFERHRMNIYANIHLYHLFEETRTIPKRLLVQRDMCDVCVCARANTRVFDLDEGVLHVLNGFADKEDKGYFYANILRATLNHV